MKTFHADFIDPILAGGSKLCTFYHVLRFDGEEFGWVEWVEDVIFLGTENLDPMTYLASTGLEVSGTQNTDTLAVPTIDVTSFLDVTTEEEVLAGIWNGSTITVFEADYTNLPATFDETRLNIMRYGTLGQIHLRNNVFQAELLGLTAKLEATIGRVTTPLCPWMLGSVECLGTGDGGPPTIDMDDFTFAGTVTSVGANSRLRFSATALTQRNGAFTLGTIQFTGVGGGLNRNLPPMDIKSWRDKQFVMMRPLAYDVAIGDTFTAVLGDNKTRATCREVFDNIGQHAGFWALPGLFKLHQTKPGSRAPGEAAPDGNPANVPSGTGTADVDQDSGSDSGE